MRGRMAPYHWFAEPPQVHDHCSPPWVQTPDWFQVSSFSARLAMCPPPSSCASSYTTGTTCRRRRSSLAAARRARLGRGGWWLCLVALALAELTVRVVGALRLRAWRAPAALSAPLAVGILSIQSRVSADGTRGRVRRRPLGGRVGRGWSVLWAD